MTGKILHSDYNPETGVSTVTKTNKWGTVTATSSLHPDDADIANQWDGCAFAEYKADMKLLKKKIRANQHELNGMMNLYQNLAQNVKVDDPTMLRIQRQIDIKGRDITNMQEQLYQMKKAFPQMAEKALNDKRAFRNKINNQE